MMCSHWHKHDICGPHKGSKVLKIVGLTLIGITAAVAFALIFGLAVKWLWNWLMPAVFGLGTITYWQAFGILLLAKLLFGAFGGHHRDKHDRFAQKFKERHPGFTPEGGPSPHDTCGHDRYYHDFWRDEGRDAFEAYVRRIEKEDDDQPGD